MSYNATVHEGAYAASVTGFGKKLTAGYATTDLNFDISTNTTVDFAFDLLNVDGIQMVVSLLTNFYVSVNGGTYRVTFNTQEGGEYTLDSTLGLLTAGHYNGSVEMGPDGVTLYLGGVVAGHSTKATKVGDEHTFEMRSFNNGQLLLSGGLDEVGVFDGLLHGGAYTPRTAPISNTAPGLIALYHFDDNGNDSAGDTSNYEARIIPVTPDNTLFDPKVFEYENGYIKCINDGNDFEAVTGGSTLVLAFDMNGVLAPFPKIKVQINYRTEQYFELASFVNVPLPQTSETMHHVKATIGSTTQDSDVDRWDLQETATKFRGYVLDALDSPVIRPDALDADIALLLDSLGSGVFGNGTAGATDVERNDATTAFAYQVGRCLGARPTVIAFGSQGYTNPGSNGVPKLSQAWDKKWAGKARNWAASPPKVIAIVHGVNDGANDITADALTTVNGLLGATPSTTRIALVRPFNGGHEAQLQAVAASCNTPSRVFYVDTTGILNNPGVQRYDFAHLFAFFATSRAAVLLANLIRPIMYPTSSGGGNAPTVEQIAAGVRTNLATELAAITAMNTRLPQHPAAVADVQGAKIYQMWNVGDYPQTAPISNYRLTSGDTTVGFIFPLVGENGESVMVSDSATPTFTLRGQSSDAAEIDAAPASITEPDKSGIRAVLFTFSIDTPVPSAGDYWATVHVAGTTYPIGRRIPVRIAGAL